jgi:cation:H+ antiporter
MEAADSDPNHWKILLSQYVTALKQQTAHLDSLDPWFSLILFIVASIVMIWRLEALERKGFEGTALGTLVMPYASGFSNLMFAFVLAKSGGSGSLILENCLVNNVTNLTLLVGLSTLFWTLIVIPSKSRKGNTRIAKAHRINYLSLLLTLFALFFFTGAVWALARDGSIDFSDGLVLVGLFLFWQLFHIFDILKHNVLRKRSFPKSIIFDFTLIMVSGFAVYYSIERLVVWIPRTGPGFFVFENLGWLSGILMVLPNGMVALYYAKARRADVVYTSQIGDGHICIPMCVGLFALFNTIQAPPHLDLSVSIILGAGLLHFVFVALLGRLPRGVGVILTGAYGFFLYRGLIN